MKNIILTCLFAVTITYQTYTYHPILLASCVAPLSVVVGKTVWDYVTKDTEKNASKCPVQSTFFKNILKTAMHNIMYIGLPISVVGGVLCYANQYQSGQQNKLFSQDLKQMILHLLPRAAVQMDNEQKLELKGAQELTDSFIEQYGSTVKTATKNVAIKTVKGIVYVAREVANIIKASLPESMA